MNVLGALRTLVWAAGLAASAAVQLAAQEGGGLLRGTLVTEGDGTPVTWGRVELLDGRGVAIDETLSDQGGGFSLRIATPGVYRARVSRIGYESWVSDTLHFATASPSRTLRLDVPVRPVLLPDLLALAESACPAPVDELRRAAAMYESVRPALASVGSTADLGALRMRMVRPTITWRRGARGYGYDTAMVVVSRAYENASPSHLEALGYAEVVDTLPTFYAPDGDAMASPGFLPTHCLSVVEGDDDGTTGLAFEPKPGRASPESVEPVGVRGVLWIDTLAMGPVSLEFEYTSLRPFLRRHLVPGLREQVQAPLHQRVQFSPVRIRDGIGGTFEFERIAPARWMIRKWRIGSPALLHRGWFGVDGAVGRARRFSALEQRRGPGNHSNNPPARHPRPGGIPPGCPSCGRHRAWRGAFAPWGWERGVESRFGMDHGSGGLGHTSRVSTPGARAREGRLRRECGRRGPPARRDHRPGRGRGGPAARSLGGRGVRRNGLDGYGAGRRRRRLG